MAPLAAGDRFPGLRLQTPDGPVELADRWRQGPLVVVFMRHFGCAFCREQLAQLGRAYGELRDLGADVVAVFQYGARASADFCSSRGVPFDCLGDPLREAYRELALPRGRVRQLLGLRVARRLPRATLTAGVPVGRPRGGDMAQLPGTFVVGPDGVLALAHYSETSADNPPTEAVLAAVRRAARAGG